MLGFERVNIRKKMRGTIISQLNRISRKSASKTMIWALAGMMRYTSDGDSSFINGFPDGKGGGTIIVKTNTLISYMSINKNKHPEEIESLLESLHGEAGIHCVSGAAYFDLNNIKTEQYLLESFLHALANKKYHNEHFTREDEKMMELLRDIISAPRKDHKEHIQQRMRLTEIEEKFIGAKKKYTVKNRKREKLLQMRGKLSRNARFISPDIKLYRGGIPNGGIAILPNEDLSCFSWT